MSTVLAAGLPTATGLTPSNGYLHAANLPQLSLTHVTEIANSSQTVRDWLSGHPKSHPTPAYNPTTHQWTVSYISTGPTTTQAQVIVDDRTAQIHETRTGPQVAWMMARGYWGAFGRHINDPWIWSGLCALFLVPLLDIRRIVSWRTVDLCVLLSFSLSLIWFNNGQIFTSVPLVSPPLVYLGCRLIWIANRRSKALGAAQISILGDQRLPPPSFRGWAPDWLLAAIAMLGIGLRYSLNAFDANVIDVGYAGVIGAHKIVAGAALYGHFPSDCAQCDTYGPATYLADIPFEIFAPWSGHWDSLPAAHAAASAFDILCILGLFVLGWRLSGQRLGLAFAAAWATFPFTAYALESNSNDALVAALLIWGMVFFSRPLGRGILLGLAIAAKFVPALLVVAWWRVPSGTRRNPWWYLGGLGIAALSTGWVILLGGVRGIPLFWHRTITYQVGRSSPFSLWGQHPALHPLQLLAMGIVAAGALAVWRWPRRRDLLSVVALSGALIIGLQLTMSYWFYLYIPWFLPFIFVATIPHWPPPASLSAEAAIEGAAVESDTG